MRFSRGTRLAACLLALSISLPGGLARAAESAESPLTRTEGQSVTLTLEAPQTGEYRLELEFMALTGKTVNPQATLSLSGRPTAPRSPFPAYGRICGREIGLPWMRRATSWFPGRRSFSSARRLFCPSSEADSR